MTITVRLLGPGDEHVLTLLSEQEEAFDIEGRSEPSTPPNAADAAAYLTDPGVPTCGLRPKLMRSPRARV